MSDITTIDARGLSCPEPALKAKQAIRRLTGGTVEVLVDAGTASDNVSRIAQQTGWRVAVETLPDGGLKLVLTK